MIKPEIPANEKQRLKALEAYDIIGTAENDDFDFLTSMAAEICGTKISLISLVTEDKQWFLSHHGLQARETPREYSFCAHGINNPEDPFIVESSSKDERFYDNPLVTGDPVVEFYAGIPIVSDDGFALGSLCVIDDHPKKLTDHQISLLKKLARQAQRLLELRKKSIQLEAQSNKQQLYLELLNQAQSFNKMGAWELDIKTGKTIWTYQVYDIHEVPYDFDHNKANGIEFYHPDDRPVIAEAVENAINNNSGFDVTCRFISAKGNQKWVRATGRRVEDKLIGSFQDVTDIIEAENRYKNVLEGTRAGTFEWNIQTNDVLINDRFAEMLGYSKKELEPPTLEKWIQNVHPDDIQKAQELIKKCFNRETDYFQLELRIKHKASHWVWVSTRGKIFEWTNDGRALKMYGTQLDITKRKEAEFEVLKSKEQYESLVQNIPGITYRCQYNDNWTMLYMSSQVDRITGYSAKEMIGDASVSYGELIHSEDQDLVSKAVADAIESNTSWEIEYRVMHKDGAIRWAYEKGIAVKNEENEVLYLDGFILDITHRKAIQNKLNEERSLLRTIIDSSPDSIYVKDLEGRKKIANAIDCEYCGVANEEVLIGKTDFDIFPEEIAKAMYEDDKKVLHNGEKILNKEEIVYGANGEKIWLLTSKIPLYSQERKITGLVGIGRNITERKKAENELIYNKNLLEALYDLSPIGIALNDYENGTFIDVNNKLLEPTGYTKEEFFNLSYFDITPEEYFKDEEEALKSMERSGRYGPFEKEYIRKDGSRYPVLLNGVVVEDLNGQKLIWSFIQDISTEKEAKRKLHEAISRLQAVLDASTQVSIIATDTEGTITLFNSGAESMLGYKADEMIGEQTPQIIHLESEIAEHGKALQNEFNTPIDGFDVFVYKAKMGIFETKEWTYITKDGAKLPVLLSVTAIRDGDEIIGYLGVATDISELKKAQSEVQSLLDITKEQNDRLVNFAHIVTHNLRNHVTGFQGWFDIIEIENPDIYQYQPITYLQQISKNLETTIGDLTEIVRTNLNRPDFEPINVSRVVQKNLESLSSIIKDSDFKIYNTVAEEIEVRGVPAYMDSIVLNFLTNAIKYRAKDRESYLKIRTVTTDTTTKLIFEDNGLGIDLEKYGDKLFGIYQRFHNKEDSRGVGLFITKNQIEAMGGSIEVESKVNVGTTFTITFPNT